MSKAEERALEAYPDYPTMDGGYVTQRKTRKVFIQGYEQAEKDLELTWEDMQLIWQIFDTMNDECKGKTPGWMFGSKTFFNEALKRFKEAKK